MYYVYLIKHDLSGKLYIGTTDDPVRRLKTHNGNGKKFTTRKSGKWHFIYLELYRSKQDAIVRERRLKGHAKGKHELLKRLTNSLLEPKIGEGRSESIPGDCLPKTQLPANP